MPKASADAALRQALGGRGALLRSQADLWPIPGSPTKLLSGFSEISGSKAGRAGEVLAKSGASLFKLRRGAAGVKKILKIRLKIRVL